ncbi:MAG: MerR family transcriptional regulator [Myxococcales bacterium]|nr:MAG: MerR family transcriptional regulator [Myxococcales bacterium]
MDSTLTIAEAAAACGVTVDTLRYYEKIGLLARVPRSRSGHRRYGDAEVSWVRFLRKLHATGMPIRRMVQYARLARRGDATYAERRALLEAHRAEVVAKLDELTTSLALIDRKIALYRGAGDGAASSV